MTRTQRQRLSALVAGGLVALGIAGCAGSADAPQVASAGGADQSAAADPAQPAADEEERGRQFAACMREQGIDLPDPDPNGGHGQFRRMLEAADREQLMAALEACREYMPNGGQHAELSPEDLEQMREFAECMREHGIDMPDPDPEGGRIPLNDHQLDLRDPKLQEALDACRDLRPQPGEHT